MQQTHNQGYITRAHLNSAHSIAALLRRDAKRDNAHGLIWTLFENQENQDRRFLFNQSSNNDFIIVSTAPPEDMTGVWALETKPYTPALNEGDELRFFIKVNPAMVIKATGRRTDAIMHAKSQLPKEDRAHVDRQQVLSDWLQPRLERNGARLNSLSVKRWELEQIRPTKGAPHRIGIAELEGILTVTDSSSFVPSLFSGYGKARSYGYGLLLVQRI